MRLKPNNNNNNKANSYNTNNNAMQCICRAPESMASLSGGLHAYIHISYDWMIYQNKKHCKYTVAVATLTFEINMILGPTHLQHSYRESTSLDHIHIGDGDVNICNIQIYRSTFLVTEFKDIRYMIKL